MINLKESEIAKQLQELGCENFLMKPIRGNVQIYFY